MSDFLSFLNAKEKESDTDFESETVVKDNDDTPENTAKRIYGEYASKSEDELLAELDKEIERRKRDGGISQNEINSYISMLSPFLNEEQKKRLAALTEKLK